MPRLRDPADRRPAAELSVPRHSLDVGVPVVTAVTEQVCLDWNDSAHWSRWQAGCVHCHLPTHLRDAGGRPSHKTCAERLITAARLHPVSTTEGTTS